MKRLFFVLLLICALSAISVSDSDAITIHIVGDSTVCTYRESAYPQTGWGQIIGSFFDGSKVQINNVAIGGRSSKTFIEEGRLAGLKSSVKAGDFIFIQWGHNDRYFGSSSRQVPFDSLGYFLQQYVDSAKAWGATPVFVSPMNMNMGSNGRNIFTEYNVVGKMEELAKANQIPFVDLNTKSYNAYSKTWNANYVSRYQFKYFLPGEYPNYPDGVTNDGTTHFQESGSIAHCQWIVEELESALTSESYLSAELKARLTVLLAAVKPRYAFTVKANVSAAGGLITHNQELPGGAPLTLHVSPGSFGKTFKGWYDDDCNLLSTDSNYYGGSTLYRAATYTAVFDGGSACVATAHGSEEISSSSAEVSSSAAESSSSFRSEICFSGVADAAWPSPVDMSFPEVGEGTTDTNHLNYTGVGFFNIANNASSEAVYKITSDQSASNARVMIRYSFDGAANRDMQFQIDNFTYDVSFPPTGGWDVWDTAYIENVWVDALDFDLTIRSTTDNGGPNIDMIAFDIAKVYRTGCAPADYERSSSSAQASSSSESSDAIRRGIVPSAFPKVLNGRLYDALGHRIGNGSGKDLPKGIYFGR